MNIILLGPQGSGKGTQAKLLREKFGYYHFEMGEFLRELAKSDPVIYEYQNKKGKLVPDDMFFFAMKKLIGEKIKEGKDILLDGFPRSVNQYKILKNWFEMEGLNINKVLFVNISRDETLKRLSNRRTCKECGKIWNIATSPKPPSSGKCVCGGDLVQRDDDKPEAIERRLQEYYDSTEPLLKLLKTDGILEEVDGERDIDDIQKDLVSIIEKVQSEQDIY